MSMDGMYIFLYHDYTDVNLAKKDAEIIEKNYGGEVVFFEERGFFYEKPKYIINQDDLNKFNANIIIKSFSGGGWEISKI